MSSPTADSIPGAGARAGPVPAGARIRLMEDADVDRVAALESSAFTIPWKATTFRNLLDRPGAVVLVLEAPLVPVAGYAVLWCIKDQGELANIAVVPELRDRGLGAYLLDQVLVVARDRGVRTLYLEVRGSNARARFIYASRGFEEIGMRRDYYEKPREDARVLMKRLSPTR